MSRRKRKNRKKRNRAAENRSRNRRTNTAASMRTDSKVNPQTVQPSKDKANSIADDQHESMVSLNDDNNSEQALIEEAESIIHKAVNDETSEGSDDGTSEQDPDSSQSSEDRPVPAKSEEEAPESDDSIPGFDVNDLDDGEFVDDEDDHQSEEDDVDEPQEDDEDIDEPDTATFADIEDEVLSSDDGSGVVRSVTNLKDSLITYETEGFINPDTGKPYNRFHLMSHPVKLVFKQHVQGDDPDEYESVGFVVNRSLAYELSVLFENIRRSYDGQPLDRKDRVKEKLSWSSVKRKTVRMVRDHPVQVGITAILIVAIIVILFIL